MDIKMIESELRKVKSNKSNPTYLKELTELYLSVLDDLKENVPYSNTSRITTFSERCRILWLNRQKENFEKSSIEENRLSNVAAYSEIIDALLALSIHYKLSHSVVDGKRHRKYFELLLKDSYEAYAKLVWKEINMKLTDLNKGDNLYDEFILSGGRTGFSSKEIWQSALGSVLQWNKELVTAKTHYLKSVLKENESEVFFMIHPILKGVLWMDIIGIIMLAMSVLGNIFYLFGRRTIEFPLLELLNRVGVDNGGQMGEILVQFDSLYKYGASVYFIYMILFVIYIVVFCFLKQLSQKQGERLIREML